MTNLSSLLDQAAADYPDRPAIKMDDLALSYAQLREADTAARYASNPHDDSDITVTAIAAVTCVGTTQADALRAVADWALEAQHMQIHSIALAQMEGPVEDSWECHVTLTVSSRDPETREFGGSTHHVPRSGR